MKKFSIFTAIFMIMMLVFCTTLSFAKDTGAYIGMGMSHACSDFEIDDEVSGALNYIGLSPEFGSTNGLNLKVGYRFNNMVAFEFDFNHLPDFDWNGSISGYGDTLGLDAEVDIKTFMVVGKFSPDFGFENVKPFISAGVGVIHSKLELDARSTYESVSDSDSDLSTCFKTGIGMDIFVDEHLSIGLGVDYVMTSRRSINLVVYGQDMIDNLDYVNYTMGVAYHF